MFRKVYSVVLLMTCGLVLMSCGGPIPAEEEEMEEEPVEEEEMEEEEPAEEEEMEEGEEMGEEAGADVFTIVVPEGVSIPDIVLDEIDELTGSDAEVILYDIGGSNPIAVCDVVDFRVRDIPWDADLFLVRSPDFRIFEEGLGGGEFNSGLIASAPYMTVYRQSMLEDSGFEANFIGETSLLDLVKVLQVGITADLHLSLAMTESLGGYGDMVFSSDIEGLDGIESITAFYQADNSILYSDIGEAISAFEAGDIGVVFGQSTDLVPLLMADNDIFASPIPGLQDADSIGGSAHALYWVSPSGSEYANEAQALIDLMVNSEDEAISTAMNEWVLSLGGLPTSEARFQAAYGASSENPLSDDQLAGVWFAVQEGVPWPVPEDFDTEIYNRVLLPGSGLIIGMVDAGQISFDEAMGSYLELLAGGS